SKPQLCTDRRCWLPVKKSRASPPLLPRVDKLLLARLQTASRLTTASRLAGERTPAADVLRGWNADTKDPLGLTLSAPGEHVVKFYVDTQPLSPRVTTPKQYAHGAEGDTECFSPPERA